DRGANLSPPSAEQTVCKHCLLRCLGDLGELHLHHVEKDGGSKTRLLLALGGGVDGLLDVLEQFGDLDDAFGATGSVRGRDSVRITVEAAENKGGERAVRISVVVGIFLTFERVVSTAGGGDHEISGFGDAANCRFGIGKDAGLA